jgi:hypothetical protein
MSKERNMFVVAERFLSNLSEGYDKHPVSTDGDGTWRLHNKLASF